MAHLPNYCWLPFSYCDCMCLEPVKWAPVTKWCYEFYNIHGFKTKVLPSLWNLMEKESIDVDELTSFASNIRKEVCVVLESFFLFLKKIEEKKTHNIFSLMLDSRFKRVCFVISFIGREQGVAIVENMIANPYIPCCWSVITICILWQNLKVFLLTLVLMKIAIWIHLNKLPTQVNQQKNLWTWSFSF